MDTPVAAIDAWDMWWHATLKAKAGSIPKAAVRLFPEWKKKARKEVERDNTTPVALANRIRSLNREGDTTGWWRIRPVLRQLLAEFVEQEADQIFGHADRTHAMSFREFPGLPALERDEAPCRVLRSGSVFGIARAAAGDSERRWHWIVVPPGVGKSLAIEVLRLRYPGEVSAHTVIHLAEAAALTRRPSGSDSVRPFVVEVEEPDPINDASAIAALEMHGASVVVLAPFEHPDARSGASTTWVKREGALDANWVLRMLEWVDARLDASPRDSKFDRKAVLKWLEARPWLLRAVQSPRDLLALCADFDAYGEDGSPEQRAERWLRTIGTKALPEDEPRYCSANAAADCVVRMIEVHTFDRETALQARSFEGWANLIGRTSPPSEDILSSKLVASQLRAAGILRAAEEGVEISPKWVAEAIAQQRVVQQMKAGDVRAWGAIAGDASRQSLVDGAFDMLTSEEIRDAGESLLFNIANQAVTFAEVAALEALVAALGRRLVAATFESRDAELAKRALVQQLEYLVSGANISVLRVPTTRRDPDEWFLSGWAISLASVGAKVKVPDDLHWVLPGWALGLALSEAAWPNQFPWSSQSPPLASEAVQKLMLLTSKAVARLVPSAVPSGVPRLLLPALLLAKGWMLTHEHLSALSGTWEETVLVDAFERLDEGRRADLASTLWRLAGEAAVGSNAATVAERIDYLHGRHTPLLSTVLKGLPSSVVEETARTAGTHRRPRPGNAFVSADPRALRYLDTQQRTAAVRARLSRDIQFDEVRELVEVLDGKDLDLLLDVIRAADRDAAAEFAHRVWRVLPERSRAEARKAYAAALPSAEAWFRMAPRAQMGALLEVVMATRSRPQWVREWALVKLLDAGVHSESLFQLTRSRDSSTSNALNKSPRKKKARR